MDQRVQALGLEGVRKRAVSRVAQERDARVAAFRQRPLEGRYPSGWLDAKYVKVREGDRVLRRALVVAIGVRETGERAGLGFDLGWSEEVAFWMAFLRRLRERGLTGVLLVIRDADQGLQQAIWTVASWPRCRGPCLRHRLSHVPRSASAGGGLVRTICAQVSRRGALKPLRDVVSSRPERFPSAATGLWTWRRMCSPIGPFPRSTGDRSTSPHPLEPWYRELVRRGGDLPERGGRIAAGRGGPPGAAGRVGSGSAAVLQQDLDGQVTAAVYRRDGAGGGSVREGQPFRRRDFPRMLSVKPRPHRGRASGRGGPRESPRRHAPLGDRLGGGIGGRRRRIPRIALRWF
ncbi:protein of unknown function [Candidatus Hydrogenisulfobacillus filiaventi]|uniref:Mutator family transposase n=1 Tax=Candidatus Hydrogenisulfobacillus filiaventi TaxID=2707344 RepID=A0A6F8ZFW9_9FIRM|nr:protein of unknown function [Candidatus Hydrogenisulfobacillus filiaventi]